MLVYVLHRVSSICILHTIQPSKSLLCTSKDDGRFYLLLADIIRKILLLKFSSSLSFAEWWIHFFNDILFTGVVTKKFKTATTQNKTKRTITETFKWRMFNGFRYVYKIHCSELPSEQCLRFDVLKFKIQVGY